jgi:hypothetical protein
MDRGRGTLEAVVGAYRLGRRAICDRLGDQRIWDPGDFGTQDLLASGSVDPQPNPISQDLDDGDPNVITNHDSFTNLATEY